MILGFILLIVGFVILALLVLSRREGLGILLCFCFMSAGTVLVSSPLTGPDYHEAPYSVRVDGHQYYFSDYNRYMEKTTTVGDKYLLMD